MSDPWLILFYSAEGGTVSNFGFRVLEHSSRRRAASDPHESFQFLNRVNRAPGASRLPIDYEPIQATQDTATASQDEVSKQATSSEQTAEGVIKNV